MSDHSSSFTSPSPLLYLINSLPLSSLSIPGLLSSHKPLVRPSQLTQQPLNKFLNRLNSALLSKHADGGAERRAACEIARLVVEQDEEGYVVMQWGKGWVGTCLSAVSVS